MIHYNVGGIRDPLKHDLALEFCRKTKQNKHISILTGTHINHDQIHHETDIRNNWLGPIFFYPKDSHTNRLLVLIHPGLQGITEVDIDPKRVFVSFEVTPLLLMTEFSVFMSLQGIAPGNSWLGDVSLKDYIIIWKIKMREMQTK